ncbi:hypothetical protein GGS24DRAFT_474438 [Hypoxylon argillaceum]|nr:hypothetical protein GGS24DRAFT_474438 [Hypoxylon argillaceum]
MDSPRSSTPSLSSPQRIPCKDIDPRKLCNTLDRLFGEKQYKLVMQQNTFKINAARELSKEDISSCYYWQCAKGSSCWSS